jgi:predicted ATPase
VAPIGVSQRRPFVQVSTTVGRTKETRELQRAIDEVRTGRGLLLCVTGEAGIGKSTLVERFLDSLEGQPVILRGRCSERLAPGEPHLPILEALETLLRGEVDSTIAKVLAQRAPSWYALVGSDIGPQPRGHGSSQERRKREIAAFLEELAWSSPVILWLDDLHWADPSTLDLVIYLTTRFEGQRLLIIGGYRPPELVLGQELFAHSLRDLSARGRCRELSLEFLTQQDVDAYLALEFPGNGFPSELARLLYQRTEGNPLFLTDLVRHLKERGDISRAQGRWTVASPLAAVAGDFPNSVRNLIDGTIDRLDPTDRQILVAGSVQGVEFDSAVVAAALAIPAVDVEERLARLARVHNIVRAMSYRDTAVQPANERYAFVHVLYHEALYASLVPSRRATLSGAVADALRATEHEQPQRIAHQLALLLEAAHRPLEAIDEFLVAARRALSVSATREAASLANRGLVLVSMLPPDRAALSREVQLLITRAVPLTAMTGYANPEVERIYTRAQELCRRLGDSAAMVPISWGQWVLYHVRADLRRALDAARQALALSERADDPRMMFASHIFLGYTRGHLGELHAALDHVRQAESLFDPVYHAFFQPLSALDPGVAGLAQQGRLLCLLGDPDRALDRAREAVAMARSICSPNSLGFALVWQAYVLQLRNERNAVRDVTAEALALAAEHGLADVQGWAAVWHAWGGDDCSSTLNVMQQSLEAQRRFGSEIARPHQLALVADVMSRTGDTTSALRTIDEALEQAARTGDCYYEAELYRMKGELLQSPGAPADQRRARAIECFNKAIEVARRQGAHLFEKRATANLASI